MFETHEPQIIRGFRGLWKRGPDESCPLDRLLEAHNVIFTRNSIKTRRGTALARVSNPDPNFFNEHFNIIDSAFYEDLGSQFLLHSEIISGAGKLFNNFVRGSSGASAILSIAGWDGLFEILQIGDLIFILPSLTTANLYVWKASWSTAREAGCTVPSGTAMAIANGAASGNESVEIGNYTFGVVFETDTGYLSKIGPYNAGVKAFTHFWAQGGLALNFSNVPVGPAGAGIIKRHLVASRGTAEWNGNFDSREMFFIPNAIINDNVTTTLNGVKFYNDDLVKSADHLFDRLERIPNATGMTIYANRLVMYGDKNDRNAIRISNFGEYEGFDAVDGLITTAIKRPTGINTIGELRGTLYIFKNEATIGYQDNGQVPAEWPSVIVDRAKTTTKIGRVNQTVNSLNDVLIAYVDNRLVLFNGIYGPDISSVVEDLSLTVNDILIFPKDDFLILPSSATQAWFVDFSQGLDPDNVKWSKLDYSRVGNVINWHTYNGELLLTFTQKVLKGNPVNGNQFSDQTNPNELGDPSFVPAPVAIESYATLPYAKPSPYINHFLCAQLRATSNGSISPTIYGKDRVKIINAANIFLSAVPGKYYVSKFNLVNELCSLKIKTDTLLVWFELEEAIIHGKMLWTLRGA